MSASPVPPNSTNPPLNFEQLETAGLEWPENPPALGWVEVTVKFKMPIFDLGAYGVKSLEEVPAELLRSYQEGEASPSEDLEFSGHITLKVENTTPPEEDSGDATEETTHG